MNLYRIAAEWGVPVRVVEALTVKEVIEQLVFYALRDDKRKAAAQHQAVDAAAKRL